jgi:hypothetical protein
MWEIALAVIQAPLLNTALLCGLFVLGFRIHKQVRLINSRVTKLESAHAAAEVWQAADTKLQDERYQRAKEDRT